MFYCHLFCYLFFYLIRFQRLKRGYLFISHTTFIKLKNDQKVSENNIYQNWQHTSAPISTFKRESF